MTARVQENRTATPNQPPANNTLAVGELYIEMADPLRLWTGVPVAVAASGVRLILDANATAVAVAGAVQKAGDTMTGPLVLSGTPTAPAQAANKAYVDQTAPGLAPVQSVATRTGNVVLAHTDITDWTATLAAALTPYAPLASPALTGAPTAPTPAVGSVDTKIATTQFVAASFAPLASPLFTGDPRAPTAAPGDNDTSIATTAFVKTAIGSGFAPIGSPAFTGDPTAPTPAYGDNDTSVATTAFVQAAVAPMANNVGRNLVHNPFYNVAQRGVGPFAASGYTLDRWAAAITTDTVSMAASPTNDTQRTAIGDEAAVVVFTNNFTGSAAAGAFHYIGHSIEGIRRLSGKTVTLSFWAVASAALKLGVNYNQNFGTGGPASVSSWASPTGQSVTLSTTWTRYSVTTAIPSASGKTLGTSNNDALVLGLFFSSGANVNAIAGNIGVQSGTIQLWGVQLEIGSVATPLEKPDPQQDLAKCQRFYNTFSWQAGGYNATSGPMGPCAAAITFPTMRATPTANVVNPNGVNSSAFTLTPISPSSAAPGCTLNAGAAFVVGGTLIFSADL